MGTTPLPLVIQYAQALGPTLVAIIVGAIAFFIQFRMWKNAENKLKIELFDRRFAVLQSFNKSRSKALVSGEIADADLNDFDIALSESYFLFDKKTNEFMQKLRDKLVFLMVYDMKTINESGLDRKNLIEKKYEYKMAILHSYTEMRNVMRPFLDMSSIKS